MARKSNKTAHVLNLLAGHDAAKDPDEQISEEQEAFDTVTAEAVQTSPDGAAENASGNTAGQAIPSNTGHPASPDNIPAPAPIPIPATPPQNNIAMIDKTEDDPVAELIQQKLSSEFEKQIQQSQPAPSAPTVDEPVAPAVDEPIAAAVAPTIDEPAAAPDTTSMDEPVAAPDAPTIDEPAAVPDTTTIDEPAAVPDTTTIDEPAAVPDTPAIDEPIAAPATPTVDTPVASPTVPTMDEPAAAPAASTANEPVASPAVQTADEQMAPAETEPELPPEPEEDFAAVNVMEHIVNDKIIYFMRQFDVCTCSRCKADVTALTLNGLMPKYIVTMKAAVDPLLSYYTNRLISDVTVEATKACMVVKENPRH